MITHICVLFAHSFGAESCSYLFLKQRECACVYSVTSFTPTDEELELAVATIVINGQAIYMQTDIDFFKSLASLRFLWCV